MVSASGLTIDAVSDRVDHMKDCVQFNFQDYMGMHDVARRAAVGFKEYVDELRSMRSKKPNTGLKGVNERGSKFEARNTPFPVRSRGCWCHSSCLCTAGAAAVGKFRDEVRVVVLSGRSVFAS